MPGHSEEQLRKCFDKFDQDGSGEISRKELVAALTEFTQGDAEQAKVIARQVLKDADADGDGKITWLEFKCALM